MTQPWIYSFMTQFSVLTIAKNDRRGLRRTAQSLAEQNFQDFQWIIKDGGSDDGTAQDLPAYQENMSAQVICAPDSGICRLSTHPPF
jgi:hypothetical protein